MAEICFDCYNKLCGGTESRKEYHITRSLDLCEECGEYRPVIICMKKRCVFKHAFLDWVADMRTLYGKK